MKNVIFLFLFLLLSIVSNAQVEKINSRISFYYLQGDSILLRYTNFDFLLSTDNGDTWTDLNLKDEHVCLHPFAFQNNLIIGQNQCPPVYTDSVIYLSKDLGLTWKRNLLKRYFNDDTIIVGPISITAIKVIDNNIFLGTEEGLFISTDFGTNWFCSPIYAYWDPELQLWGGQRLYVDNNRIFVSYYGEGIYFSFDIGKTWNCTTANLENYVESVTKHYSIYNPITYSVSDSVLAVVFQKKNSKGPHSLVYSTDLGNTWQFSKYEFSYNDNIYADTAISGVLGCGRNLYISTDKGFFYSTDFGTKWIPLKTGLDSSTPYNQMVGQLKKNDKYIFFTTGISGAGGGGFYRLKIKDCEPVFTGINEPEIEFITQSIFPNPASDYITIPSDEPGAAPRSLTVYNMMGEKVIGLDAAPESGRIDVSGLSPGVYCLVVTKEKEAFRQRFVVSR